jgi:hypothetical protein
MSNLKKLDPFAFLGWYFTSDNSNSSLLSLDAILGIIIRL